MPILRTRAREPYAPCPARRGSAFSSSTLGDAYALRVQAETPAMLRRRYIPNTFAVHSRCAPRKCLWRALPTVTPPPAPRRKPVSFTSHVLNSYVRLVTSLEFPPILLTCVPSTFILHSEWCSSLVAISIPRSAHGDSVGVQGRRTLGMCCRSI